MTPTPTPKLPTATPTTNPGTGGSGSGLPDAGGIGGAPISSGNIDIPGLPGGSVYQYAKKRQILLRLTSKGPIGTVGYYIPYSPDRQSGTVKNVGRSWTLRTVSFGEPAYARIYLRAGADPSVTITCSISVDGKVVERRTTEGPYALLICQG